MQPTQLTYFPPASFDPLLDSTLATFDPLPEWDQFFQVYSDGFEESLNFLMKDADVVEILKKILDSRKKKINLVFGSQKQPASYYLITNTIALSDSFQGGPLQEKVTFLFFELQNATQWRDFQNLRNRAGKLGREKYVKQIEKLEYNSSLKTNLFVHKYIERGVFTKHNSYFYVALNFRDFYLLEQLTGHAQTIALRMDLLRRIKSPYRGTWPAPLTEQQAPILEMLLCSKIVLDTPQGTSPEERKNIGERITLWMKEIDSLYSHDPKSTKALWQNAHEITNPRRTSNSQRSALTRSV